MNAAWHPGQLLFLGFEGVACPHPVAQLVAAGRVGGVVLFARNIEGPDQLRRLVAQLQDLAPAEAPLTVAIDQEGGRVARLRTPWTQWPPMARLGELDEPSWTQEVGRAIGRELADLGIGLDFAPVMDVHSNPANPVIGDRSFASTPDKVAAHGTALIHGLQETGVAACAKHFPGHGDTVDDSHLALPRLPHTLERLRQVELPPFAAAIAANVASIMTAHVIFEAIDKHRPATFAPDVISIVREQLGYERLLFSDDLEMKAVADTYQPRDMVPAALGAGIDALLVCRRFDFVTEVLAALERRRDHEIEAALTRMVAFKTAFPGPKRADPVRGPPYCEHQHLADALREGRVPPVAHSGADKE